MKTIAVSKLRSKLMEVLLEIESGSNVSITSRGKVVARLVPPDDGRKTAKEKLRSIGKTAILHDVMTPIQGEWKAQKNGNG
jgi:prevent-host-death family protein